MALAAGAMIGGRYCVIGGLGAGTYGDVYRARDTHQDMEVAVKLSTLPFTPPWLEAQTLTSLRSNYILRIRNAALDAGVPFLVTDVAEHGSADKAAGSFGVALPKAVRWTIDACRGAARAHQDDLLHRDIKPANVFVTASGGAQLADFGLAVRMNAAGRAPGLGTPITRAPEITAGGPATVQSDIYSLGATLYALLTGKYSNQIGDPPVRDLAPHVGRVLAKHVAKAIAPSPAGRFETALDFAAALGSLPDPARAWIRTDEHPMHDECYRGAAPNKQEVTVCLVPVSATQSEVVAEHVSSGRRINAACRPPAPQSRQARDLRVALSKVP